MLVQVVPNVLHRELAHFLAVLAVAVVDGKERPPRVLAVGLDDAPARKRLGLETRSNSKKKPPTAIIPGNESRRWREGASTLQDAALRTREAI